MQTVVSYKELYRNHINKFYLMSTQCFLLFTLLLMLCDLDGDYYFNSFLFVYHRILEEYHIQWLSTFRSYSLLYLRLFSVEQYLNTVFKLSFDFTSIANLICAIAQIIPPSSERLLLQTSK